MSVKFIHLRLHSEFSIVDGLIKIKPLIDKVVEQGMPAVAISDHCNLFAVVKFYKAALARGVKPICAVDILLENSDAKLKPARLTLICQNHAGYANLMHLISLGFTEGQKLGQAIIQRRWLEDYSQSLIALSGGIFGEIGQALVQEDLAQARDLCRYFIELFPQRFYLELHRVGHLNESRYIQAAVDLAMELSVPVVASNDVRFLQADDFEAHEARVCVNQGRILDDPQRPREYSDQQYLKSPDEMAELFADLPEALENTVIIAQRCNLELTLGENYLPTFPIASGLSEAHYLIGEAERGLSKRLESLFGTSQQEKHEQIQKEYAERLALELGVIIDMGFPGYFLIVSDFIRWAKQQGIPVGPGRGSGAGSLVAFALEITDLDPIAYDLLFERFLNPERVSMPDFDVDFCMEGRDRVIEYVSEKYGKEAVSQIITYGSMAARAVVRDVGRVLGMGYGQVDKLAKLIPFEIGMTLEKAFVQEKELSERYDAEEEVRNLWALALKLEGLVRNVGKHAGGVVIAPSKLTDFTPLYCDSEGGSLVCQYDKDDVESVGLVKFDFLGLRTLTIIDWAVKAINKALQKAPTSEGKPLDISQIPLDDSECFKLLQSGYTTGVFQLESRGMQELIKRLKPNCFEDIIALVALFRPGPLQSGMVDDFVNRKNGRAKVAYPHADLAPILKPTYGVILYQEQVMQIAQVLAGYSLGGADLLRRAMGKKKPEEMAKQRVIFLKGAVGRQVPEKVATNIFDLMEKFAGYGFNKSHSAAYALVSYQTAWLKSHYPAAFMAAVLSADMDNTDKIVVLIEDAKAQGLQVNPPQINQGAYRFEAADEKTIIYGLGAIKGLGESAIACLLQARGQGGAFKDLYELCRRVDLRKVNKRALEALICAGAFDAIGIHRAAMIACIPAAQAAAEQISKAEQVGQGDLFGSLKEEDDLSLFDCTKVRPWEDAQLLSAEKETLGLYLSGHPIERYSHEIKSFCSARLGELASDKKGDVVLAGLITGFRNMISKKGASMAFVTLDDGTGRMELGVFPEAYNQGRDLLVKDTVVVVQAKISKDDYNGKQKVAVRCLMSMDQAREHYAKGLEIEISHTDLNSDFIDALNETIKPYQGGNCPIKIHYSNSEASAWVIVGQSGYIQPTEVLLKKLHSLLGKACVSLRY